MCVSLATPTIKFNKMVRIEGKTQAELRRNVKIMLLAIVIRLSIPILYHDSVGCMVGFYPLVISALRYKSATESICVRAREDHAALSA